ncbi:MAG: YesL family protein [Oscillospiraceae bacterium]|nr:YesL family protein [Oscillospiraceae bacterium]
MSIWNRHFDRPGPGVDPDAPRATGPSRYFEVIGRDYPDLLKANLLVVLAGLPGAALYLYGLIFGGLLPSLAGCVLGGALAGPCLAGLYDTVLRALRDEPGYWWHRYKRAFKANWRQAAALGALMFGLFGVQLWALLSTGGVGYIAMAACMVVTLALFAPAWPMMALMELPLGDLLKNAVALLLNSAPRVMGAAALQAVWWGLHLRLAPISLFTIPLLGFWPCVLAAVQAVYPPINETFRIEERIGQRREAEMNADE